MKSEVEEGGLLASCKMLPKRHIREFSAPPPFMFTLDSSVLQNCFKLVPDNFD